MPDDNDKETGKRLKQLRTEAGFTQSGLSAESGVDANTIARLERGEHTPTNPTLRKLAAALGVKVSDILGY